MINLGSLDLALTAIGKTRRAIISMYVLALTSVACTAHAVPMPINDALRIVQGLSVEADWISSTQPPGPTITYTYDELSRTTSSWTGKLTGGTFDLNYTGDITQYATDNKINWFTLGTIDGNPYGSNSWMLVTPYAGGVEWRLETTSMLGGSQRVFTMSGLALETVDGYEIPYTESGRLTADGILLATTYSIWSRPGTYTMFDDENGIYNTYWNSQEKEGSGLLTATFIAPIPEPSTLSLVLLSGVLGLRIATRRPRNRRLNSSPDVAACG